MIKLIFGVMILSLGLSVHMGPPSGIIFHKAYAADAAPAADHDEEGAAAVDKPSFIQMDPLVVPIVDTEGVSQVVSLAITLEVMAPGDVEIIQTLRPRVKDAMIQNMYGLLNHNAAMNNGVLQVGYVKKRLTVAIEKVVGTGVLKDVLLQMVQQNPV